MFKLGVSRCFSAYINVISRRCLSNDSGLTILKVFRKHLMSNIQTTVVRSEIQDLMGKNRLDVLKEDSVVISRLLKSGTLKELPFLCYLLFKVSDRNLVSLLQQKLEKVPSFEGLTLIEVQIICSTAFTASIGINNRDLLEDLSNRLVEYVSEKNLSKELLPTVKFLRKSKFYHRPAVDFIHSFLCNSKYENSLTTLCHYLAWIVDSEYVSVPVTSSMLEKINHCLSNDKKIRGKDIDRLIWILSFQQDISKDLLKKLINVVLEKDLHFPPLRLGNTLLNFAFLGVYDERLTEQLLEEKVVAEITRTGEGYERPLSRIGLFLEAAEIEAHFSAATMEKIGRTKRDLQKKLMGQQIMDVSQELRYKKGLAALKRIADRHGAKYGLSDIAVEAPVPYLAISGITCSLTKHRDTARLSVEVIDKHSWRADSVYEPGRVLSLKIRLLKRLGWNVALVNDYDLLQRQSGSLPILEMILNQLGT